MFKPVFNATNEWQELPEGMSVPGGCHVRMDITTGKQSVKLDSDKHDNSALVVQNTLSDTKKTGENTATASSTNNNTKHTENASVVQSPGISTDELRSDKPTSWKGLLEWSMKYKDGTVDSEFTPLDDERRRFLKNALNSLDGELKSMQQALNIIAANFSGAFSESLNEDELESKEEALEDLSELVDSIDNALALTSMGGYPYVIAVVKSAYPSLVYRALDVLAITTQNNPDCQEYCLKEKVLEIVLPLLNAQENRTVQTKALYFMSSLIRHHEVATAEFIKLEGISSLVNVISEQRKVKDVRLATKAVFLLNIVLETTEIPEELISRTVKDTDLIASLVEIASIPEGDSNAQLRELVLCVLLRLRKASVDTEQVLYDPKLNTKQVMSDIQTNIKALPADDREAQLESLEYTDALLR